MQYISGNLYTAKLIGGINGARGYISNGNIYELKRKVVYYLENNIQ
ncbi:MAG: hypothetical protein AABY39_01045 [Nitrospirota bacterium]